MCVLYVYMFVHVCVCGELGISLIVLCAWIVALHVYMVNQADRIH